MRKRYEKRGGGGYLALPHETFWEVGWMGSGGSRVSDSSEVMYTFRPVRSAGGASLPNLAC